MTYPNFESFLYCHYFIQIYWRNRIIKTQRTLHDSGKFKTLKSSTNLRNWLLLISILANISMLQTNPEKVSKCLNVQKNVPKLFFNISLSIDLYGKNTFYWIFCCIFFIGTNHINHENPEFITRFQHNKYNKFWISYKHTDHVR